jgi:hypothetical protein
MFVNLLRRWVVMAIAVPLVAAGIRRLSRSVESRRGPSRATSMLRRSADVLHRRPQGRSRRGHRGVLRLRH